MTSRFWCALSYTNHISFNSSNFSMSPKSVLCFDNRLLQRASASSNRANAIWSKCTPVKDHSIQSDPTNLISVDRLRRQHTWSGPTKWYHTEWRPKLIAALSNEMSYRLMIWHRLEITKLFQFNVSNNTLPGMTTLHHKIYLHGINLMFFFCKFDWGCRPSQTLFDSR